MIKYSYFCMGITQSSRLSGQEYLGLLLLTIAALDGLLPFCRDDIQLYKLLDGSLILYQLMMKFSNTDSDVINFKIKRGNIFKFTKK